MPVLNDEQARRPGPITRPLRATGGQEASAVVDCEARFGENDGGNWLDPCTVRVCEHVPNPYAHRKDANNGASEAVERAPQRRRRFEGGLATALPRNPGCEPRRVGSQESRHRVRCFPSRISSGALASSCGVEVGGPERLLGATLLRPCSARRPKSLCIKPHHFSRESSQTCPHSNQPSLNS